MRIPTERPAGLLGPLYHRPGSDEQRLIADEADALAAYHARPATEDFRRAEAAADDHRSYLASVWMPRHPVRAAIESWCRRAPTGGRPRSGNGRPPSQGTSGKTNATNTWTGTAQATE